MSHLATWILNGVDQTVGHLGDRWDESGRKRHGTNRTIPLHLGKQPARPDLPKPASVGTENVRL